MQILLKFFVEIYKIDIIEIFVQLKLNEVLNVFFFHSFKV